MEPGAWASRLRGERMALEVVEEEREHVERLPQDTQMVPSRTLICQDGMLATNLSKVC